MKNRFWCKLKSHKLWIAVAGFVSGLILALGGKESTAATVSGCILQGAAVLGYLISEGMCEAAANKSAGETKELSPAAENSRGEEHGSD